MTVVGSQARHIPARPRGPRPGSSEGAEATLRGSRAAGGVIARWPQASSRSHQLLASFCRHPSLPLAAGGPSFLALGRHPAICLPYPKRRQLCSSWPETTPLPVHRSPLALGRGTPLRHRQERGSRPPPLDRSATQAPWMAPAATPGLSFLRTRPRAQDRGVNQRAGAVGQRSLERVPARSSCSFTALRSSWVAVPRRDHRSRPADRCRERSRT
jgi:hypothetical protein